MPLSSITRFPGGVTNNSETDELADLRVPSPLIYNMIYDDFNTYTAANWTVAGTTPGVPAISAAADGGVIAIPTTATNPSETSISLPNLTFTPDITKDLFVAGRIRIDDAAAGFLFGLSVGSAASPIGTQPVGGIYLIKVPGSDPVGVLRAGSVSLTSPSLPTIAANTWYDIGIAYTAANGVLNCFMNNAAARIATNPTVAQFVGAATGLVVSARVATANVRTLLLDSYLVAKVR